MNGALQPLPIGLGFGLALGCALGLTPLARRLAHRLDIVDRPDGRRKLQVRPVALLGGLAVLGALSITLALMSALGEMGSLTARLPWLLAALAAICAVGICDDAINLRARWKFVGQMLACLPLLASGFGIESISFGGEAFPLGPLGPVVSLLWFVTCINALNLIDGMDGLASTVGMWIALAAAAVSAVIGSNGASVLALALAGALAGFLKFNRPPATIYLGDAGSMTIGLATAVITLLAAEDAPGVAHVTVMLALMAIPLGDLGLAVWRRSMSGTGFWHADRGHMHHRLQETGLTNRQVLGVVTMLLIVTGSLAVASRLVGWERLAWGASLVLAVSLVRSQLIGHHEWVLTKSLVSRRWMARAARQGAPIALGTPSIDPSPGATTLAGQLEAAGRELCVALANQGVKPCRVELAIWTADAAEPRSRWQSPRSQRLSDEVLLEYRGVDSDDQWVVRAALPAAHAEQSVASAVVVLRRMAELWTSRLAASRDASSASAESQILQLPSAAGPARARRAA